MAPQPSIKIVKEGAYEGGVRRWSNRHHFTGGVPAGLAEWEILSDAIVADEAACLRATETIVEAVGYAAGSDTPVFTKAFSTVGALSSGSGEKNAPLFVCALLRFSTDQMTTKHHPIYLFSYIHAVITASGADNELLAAAQKAAIEEYGTDWIDGFSDGTVTHHRCGPNGAVAQARTVEAHVTHRDFPN